MPRSARTLASGPSLPCGPTRGRRRPTDGRGSLPSARLRRCKAARRGLIGPRQCWTPGTRTDDEPELVEAPARAAPPRSARGSAPAPRSPGAPASMSGAVRCRGAGPWPAACTWHVRGQGRRTAVARAARAGDAREAAVSRPGWSVKAEVRRQGPANLNVERICERRDRLASLPTRSPDSAMRVHS